MKHLLLLTSTILICTKLSASVWIVDNNPNNPQNFTSIQAAVDSASAWDTIMVEGSTIVYSNTVVNKPIVLIGEGYHDPLSENVLIQQIELRSSHCYITGMDIDNIFFNGLNAVNDSLYDIIIERCFLKN